MVLVFIHQGVLCLAKETNGIYIVHRQAGIFVSLIFFFFLILKFGVPQHPLFTSVY